MQEQKIVKQNMDKEKVRNEREWICRMLHGVLSRLALFLNILK
jgi:hypothetical protein